MKEWDKDTTRLDILQDIAKLYYVQENYDSALFYYKIFVTAREASGMDRFVQENAKIALVYQKMGLDTEAERLFNAYLAYYEEDQSS